MGKVELRWEEEFGPEDLSGLGLVLSPNQKRSRDVDQKHIATWSVASNKHDIAELDYLTDDGIVEALAKVPPTTWKVDDPYYLAKIVSKLEDRALPGMLRLADAHPTKSLYALTRFRAAEVISFVAEQLATKKSSKKLCEEWLVDCADVAMPALETLAASKDRRAKHAKDALTWLAKQPGAKATKTTKSGKPANPAKPATKTAAPIIGDPAAYHGLDPTAVMREVKADKTWRASLEQAAKVTAAQIAPKLPALPHLAKKKKAELVQRAEIFIETVENARKCIVDFVDGDVAGQISRKNGNFFTGITEYALEVVRVASFARPSFDVTPLLRLAARTRLVGERVAEYAIPTGHLDPLAAAVLTDTHLDAYRGLVAILSPQYTVPSVRSLCHGLLGMASGDELDAAAARHPGGDEKTWFDGRHAQLQTLAALAHGDVAGAARAAATIGAGFQPIAAWHSKRGADEHQVVDIAATAVVALVTRAGGEVPAQPYVVS